jgi:hypothetical protein
MHNVVCAYASAARFKVIMILAFLIKGLRIEGSGVPVSVLAIRLDVPIQRWFDG